MPALGQHSIVPPFYANRAKVAPRARTVRTAREAPSMYWLVNNLFPTSVGINIFIMTMLLALTTSCDGGVLLTTRGTHICLILSLILRGGRVAFISPNMRRGMVPWSIKRVADLPPNAKLHEMQQYMHGLAQVIRAATRS